MTTNPDTHPRTLGERIEARRLELGLTISEAARRATVSRNTWHEVEGDKRTKMLANTLNLFDQALNYPRGTLRAEVAAEPADLALPTSEPQRLLHTYAEMLSEEEAQAACDFIKQLKEGDLSNNTTTPVEEQLTKVWAALADITRRLPPQEVPGDQPRPATPNRRARTRGPRTA